MNVVNQVMELLAKAPWWVAVVVVPAVALAAAVTFALLGIKRAYPPVACGLVGCGTAFAASWGDPAAALAYFGVAVAAVSLFSLFLLLPRAVRREKGSREERIYRKFHEELAEPTAADALPPKVCCFEEPSTAEDSGMRLTHVTTLMNKLKGCKLTPADRLELEALGREVDGCRGKALTAEEMGRLNDCLAAVLKLTAKYKL